MEQSSHPTPTRQSRLLLALLILAASILACDVANVVKQSFDPDSHPMDRRLRIMETQAALEENSMVSENNESVLQESGSFGSSSDGEDLTMDLEPLSQVCGEGGICVAAYGVDIRGTSNAPDLIAYANAGEYASPAGISIAYTENAGPWYEWLVLKEPGDWVQAASPEGYRALGIQFWGDETNGWASVILDGVEVWRGDVTAFGTDGTNYFVYVELTGEVSGAHTLRTEVLGLPGKAGGDNVPVFYFAYRE